jgi:hypothetical protein
MNKKFHLDIEPEVYNDIQDAVDFYNSKNEVLGKKFFHTVDKHFEFLKKNYVAFAIRYDDIRCMPVRHFPFLIHYRVIKSQQLVSIKGVFNTSLNPDKWGERLD